MPAVRMLSKPMLVTDSVALNVIVIMVTAVIWGRGRIDVV